MGKLAEVGWGYQQHPRRPQIPHKSARKQSRLNAPKTPTHRVIPAQAGIHSEMLA